VVVVNESARLGLKVVWWFNRTTQSPLLLLPKGLHSCKERRGIDGDVIGHYRWMSSEEWERALGLALLLPYPRQRSSQESATKGSGTLPPRQEQRAKRSSGGGGGQDHLVSDGRRLSLTFFLCLPPPSLARGGSHLIPRLPPPRVFLRRDRGVIFLQPLVCM